MANGCESVEPSDIETSGNRIAPKVPVYVVDDLLPERIHSCSAMLHNRGSILTAFVFEGVTCGCLSSEYLGKELIKGDRIQVAAGDAEEVVLRTRLAYAEGYYSESALFHYADAPWRRVVVESKYGVVKRLRISPGALVFKLEEGQESYTASARVRFRSTDNRSHRLSVTNVPESIQWRVKEESGGVEKRLSPASELFYEDEWTVLFRIDSGAHLGPSLPPHGEIHFVVFDGRKEQIATGSLPYNAEQVDRS